MPWQTVGQQLVATWKSTGVVVCLGFLLALSWLQSSRLDLLSQRLDLTKAEHALQDAKIAELRMEIQTLSRIQVQEQLLKSLVEQDAHARPIFTCADAH